MFLDLFPLETDIGIGNNDAIAIIGQSILSRIAIIIININEY